MAKNVEIKARLHDPAAAHAVAARLSGQAPQRIEQHDTFFRCAQGRLKLRRFSRNRGELIHYERPDTIAAHLSDYVIAPTHEADRLAEALQRGLGILGVVEKTRWLYLVGQTRVHLDEVRGLGTFLEFEVVLQPGQNEAEGRAIADRMMCEFGIGPEDLIAGAYLDLMNNAE